MSTQRRQVSAQPSRPVGPEAFASRDGTALWWLTNAGFLINAHGTTVMIDPVISLASPGVSETGMRLLAGLPIEARQVPRLDAVLYTHGDDDHFARQSARELAGTGAVFIAPPPVAAEVRAFPLPAARVVTAVAGTRVEVGAVTITPTPADHPWQLRDPSRFGAPWKPGDCCGYAVETPDGVIWHTGDTRLMPEHLRMRGVEALLLDVSDCDYHLGIADAARLANAIGAPHLIAHHFGTYDSPGSAPYDADPEDVAARIEDAAARFHVLAPGEAFVVGRR